MSWERPLAVAGGGLLLPAVAFSCGLVEVCHRSAVFCAVAPLLIIGAALARRRQRRCSGIFALEKRPIGLFSREHKAPLLPLAASNFRRPSQLVVESPVAGSAGAQQAPLPPALPSAVEHALPADVAEEPLVTYVEVSARQVFDVQWSFSGKEMNALEFNRPSGTGPSGGFFRPVVDQENDYYRLSVADNGQEGQFQLRQYDQSGTLKHQLTTFGQIKAISKEVVLYSGDAQYGTLITLRKRYNYGTSAKFTGLTTAPTKERIFEVFHAVRASSFRQGCSGETPSSSSPATPEMLPDSAETSRLSRKSSFLEDCPRCGDHVSFCPRVSTFFVRNMRMLPPERKATFWWTHDDFAQFLKVRDHIGKVYRQAAKKMGVHILKVSSEGSLREEGYAQMVKEFPELAQESRRGLGLGRKKERARNKDGYIAGVLQEQARQRAAWDASDLPSGDASGCASGAEDASEADDVESAVKEDPTFFIRETARLRSSSELSDKLSDVTGPPHSGSSEADSTAPGTPLGSCSGAAPGRDRPFVFDEEALARVARSISKKDADYAHFLAKVYYEQDRIELGLGGPSDSEDHCDTPVSYCSGEEFEEGSVPTSPVVRRRRRSLSDDNMSALEDEESNSILLGEDEESNSILLGEDEDGTGFGRKEANSKGYGLSREELRKFGLSATGHSISRSRRGKFTAERSTASDGESDAESGTSDWEA